MFNFTDLFGKFQQLQKELAEAQQQLSQITVNGESGGGMVKVIATANRKIVKIEVDPSMVNPASSEILTDLIAAAVNIALENAEARAKEEMAKITKDKIPNIPGLNLSNLGFPG